MNKKLKQVLASAIVASMIISTLSGCAPSKPDTDKDVGKEVSSASEASKESKPESEVVKVKDPIEYELMFSEAPTQPYQKDTWAFPKIIKDKFNITLNITPIPSSSYADKVNMAIASNKIPDILNSVDLNTLNDMGNKGMFLNLNSQIENMPNAKKAFAENASLSVCQLNDKEWYALPSKVPHPNMLKASIDFITMVRGDILKKHNLSEPKTYDEFYKLLTELKKSYPESYPWVTRIKTNEMIFALAPSVGLDFDSKDFTKFDKSANKFVSALNDENFKFLIEFMRKCYADKLLDQEYAICNTKQWEDKIVSGKGFFAIDYLARPEMMTNAAITAGNNEYILKAMLPPVAQGGEAKVFAKNSPVSYQGISAISKSPERLAELYDWWFFGEEGSMVGFFGVENESYTVKDKVVSYKYSEQAKSINDIASKYGTDYYGFVGLVPGFFDYKIDIANDQSMLQVSKDTYALYEGQTVESVPQVVYTGEAMAAKKDYNSNIKTTMLGEIDKFIMGRNPMTGWDAFIKDMDALGYSKYVDAKNSVLK